MFKLFSLRTLGGLALAALIGLPAVDLPEAAAQKKKPAYNDPTKKRAPAAKGALAAGKNLSLKADFIGLGRDAAAPPNDHPGVINVSGNITLEADGDSAIVTPPLWGSGGVWGSAIPAYFSPSTLFTQRGSIQLRGDITKTAGADATVTLKARAGVGFMNASAVAGSISATTNKLNVIIDADSDANHDGSVQIQQDARLFVTRLGAGEAVTHEVPKGRHAWIHVARGSASVNGERLDAGDGAAVSDAGALAIQGESEADVLVFDLA